MGGFGAEVLERLVQQGVDLFGRQPQAERLTPELRAQYAPSERWRWDERSPSCPPLILDHAKEFWGYEPIERFVNAARSRPERVAVKEIGETVALG